jgi:hypothetical protein
VTPVFNKKAEVTMPSATDFIRVPNDVVINVANVSYIELTRRGGADIHFVGRAKVLHLKPRAAKLLNAHIARNGNVVDFSRNTVNRQPAA